METAENKDTEPDYRTGERFRTGEHVGKDEAESRRKDSGKECHTRERGSFAEKRLIQDSLALENLSPLTGIIQTLRGENGCPWDKKQTPETIWKCLAEETYELLAAIKDDDHDEICEELGDVLFQIVFIAEIYRERKTFDIGKSIAITAAKMIRRHPHIYGDADIRNEEDLWTNWENIKKMEKEQKNSGIIKKQYGKNTSVLDSVPSGMPALMRSYKISERAVRAGFDWKNIDEVIEKTSEEWKEFRAALDSGNRENIEMEFGDLLFTLMNVARMAGIHPEVALSASTGKFEKRFRYMENILSEKGFSLRDVPRDELEFLWGNAKQCT